MVSSGRRSWLREDEQQIFRVRRHWIALLGGILLPLLTLLGGLLLFLVIVFLFKPSTSATVVLLFVTTLGGLAWLIWRILDWENDTLTLTNERLMRIERVILIREEREEMALFRVQNVRVLVETLTANVVGFGDLEIESAGALAPIRFGPVGNPRGLQSMIFDAVTGARILGVSAGVGTGSVPGRSTTSAAGVSQPAPQPLWERFASLFIVPRSTLGRDPVIYRQHLFFLLLTEFVPLAALVVWLLGLTLEPEASDVLNSLGIPPLLGAIGYLMIGLMVGGWIGFNYIDYRNDIYVVNRIEIIDISKVPLRSEDRRQASLGVIQDVRYVQPNTLAKLLDYGNLLLETAGTMGAFTFDRVPRPRRVQQLISQRASEFRERTTREEREQRDKEVVETVEKWWQTRQPPST